MEQSHLVRKNTILFKLIKYCVTQNKPELITRYFSLFYQANPDLECVIQFYRKLSQEYQDNSYMSLQDFFSTTILELKVN